ncbi:uncharacterized protein LOC108605029 [Drosophila busckii]|uniref:uncharacterized protein LOC108605029 n=1 Tax=Drosophila busckii TaxID=30019 RepID=UPI00083F16AD|nr:uncharacterized protein LOC108605029 [Drosophila busckii]
MSDNQYQVKIGAESALASLVEHARRLQLSSVTSIPAHMGRLQQAAARGVGVETNDAAASSKKSKASSGSNSNQRNTLTTFRKARKQETEPTPPPPSPRDQCLITELRDEYMEVDELLDKMLVDATRLNQEVLYCSQHQRDLALVQEIELETTTRSFDSIFEAICAECSSSEMQEMMQRCYSVLERSNQRAHKQADLGPLSQLPNELLDMGSWSESTNSEPDSSTDKENH